MSKKPSHLTLPAVTGAKQTAAGFRELAEQADRYESIGAIVGKIRADGSFSFHVLGVCDRDMDRSVRLALELLDAIR